MTDNGSGDLFWAQICGKWTTELELSFLEYDARNPEVWKLFKKYTFAAIKGRRRKYSARTIVERIRWHVWVETDSPDGFKINDHHSPYYGRKFQAFYPEHADIFENRTTQGELGRREDNGDGGDDGVDIELDI